MHHAARPLTCTDIAISGCADDSEDTSGQGVKHEGALLSHASGQ